MENLVRALPKIWPLGLALIASACAPEPTCGLRLCDIREPACQRAVAAATACLRGQSPVEVTIRVQSQESFIAESVARGEGAVDKVLFGQWMAGLGLLGLASPDLSLAESSREQAAWVAAFYYDKSITIIDGGRPLDSRGAITLLVHEYAHALQDLTIGLGTFRGLLADDLDRLLASKAVTEGEASLLEDLAAVGLFGVSEASVPWPTVFAGWQDRARRAATATKLPVDQSLGHFPYPFGMPYVHGAYRAGGFAEIDRLYRNPPLSTAQVLAGFGVEEPARGPWAEELAADAVPVLPARYVLIDGDRLGGWLLEVFVARLIAGSPSGSDLGAAPGELTDVGRTLRADWLSIFRDSETERVSASWRLRFSSAATAEALARRLRGRGPWSTWSVDRDLVLLASADPQVLDLGRPDLPFGPVTAARRVAPTASERLREGCPSRSWTLHGAVGP